MDVKISRKRTREADLNDCTDCLPLSKRINSLTIDNSVPIPPQALFHINVNVEQNHTHNVIGQDWQPSVQSSEYLPGPSYINENHNHVPHFPTSNWSQSSSNGLNQQNDHHQVHSNFIDAPPPPNLNPSHEQNWNNASNTHASWVSSLKYNHDNMDSEYYVNNRLLFNLYVERISRTGQQPANPY